MPAGKKLTKSDVNLPSTLERSDQHAQDIYAETLVSAVEQYGDGARAHQTAFAAVKHSYEKVGDHWEAKDTKGPSDERAEGDRDAPTAGGVDANATKEHLYEIAQRLEIDGRSTMSKDELVDAINRENQRRTRRAT